MEWRWLRRHEACLPHLTQKRLAGKRSAREVAQGQSLPCFNALRPQLDGTLSTMYQRAQQQEPEVFTQGQRA